MITLKVGKDQLEILVREELKKKLIELEHRQTFWDTKDLKRQTCMSWNTILDNFFHDPAFPKAKIGGKWYYPAKETEEFLIGWLEARKTH